MPASTPNRGIPYPVPTDPINGYPTLAAQAAGNLDTHTHDASTVSSAAAWVVEGTPVFINRVTVTTNAVGTATLPIGPRPAAIVTVVRFTAPGDQPTRAYTAYMLDDYNVSIHELNASGGLTPVANQQVTLSVIASA